MSEFFQKQNGLNGQINGGLNQNIQTSNEYGFCRKCGSQIPNGSAFCPACGMSTMNYIHNNSIVDGVSVNNSYMPIGNENKTPIIFVCVGIFISAIILTIGIFLAVNKGMNSKNSGDAIQSSNVADKNSVNTEREYIIEAAKLGIEARLNNNIAVARDEVPDDFVDYVYSESDSALWKSEGVKDSSELRSYIYNFWKENTYESDDGDIGNVSVYGVEILDIYDSLDEASKNEEYVKYMLSEEVSSQSELNEWVSEVNESINESYFLKNKETKCVIWKCERIEECGFDVVYSIDNKWYSFTSFSPFYEPYYIERALKMDDVDNAATINTAINATLANEDAYSEMERYIDYGEIFGYILEDGRIEMIDELKGGVTERELKSNLPNPIPVKYKAEGADRYTLLVQQNGKAAIYAGNEINPQRWQLCPEIDDDYR